MSRPVALITGIAGGLAQLLAQRLATAGYELVGVDYRPLQRVLDFPIEVYRANYNKTRIESLFRRHRPTHVLHLGRVGNLKERIGKRFDLNVIGSRKVMDLCTRYGVRRLVIMSTFHIYGAHPANHIPIHETEPLRAGTVFPQLADAIQLDNQAVAWIYQHASVCTTLLRPCNVVGADLNNAISRYLRQRTIPVVLGFDPMMQFIDQRDVVRALLAVVDTDVSGVFNLAGRGAIALRAALGATGARVVPVPATLAALALRTAGLVRPMLPPHLIDFFKYPCVISDERLRAAFRWEPQIGPLEAVRSALVPTRRQVSN